MAEVIVITSGKGGVGKTTTTANLGTSLSLNGNKVVIIDADIGLRNLDVVMGLEERCKLKQAMIKDKRFENLFLIPAAQTRDKDAVNPEQMKKICDELREEFDYILVDCPAGIENGFKNAIAGADRALIETTPEVSAVRDADRIIGLLDANNISDHRLVVNRFKPNMVERGDMMDIEDILEILAIDLIGVVPEDDSIVVSTNTGEPAANDQASVAGKAYRNIAKRVQGEEVEFLTFSTNDTFLTRLKKLFTGK